MGGGGPIIPPSELGGGLRVSLMPPEAKSARAPDVTRRLILFVAVLVLETLVLGGVHLFLLRLTASREAAVAELTAKIEATERDIAIKEKSAEQAVVFNAQLGAAASVLDAHLHWSNMFAFLEEKARPNVHFINFNGSADGMISVDTVARTYRDVAEQIVALRDDPLVLDVRTATASAKVNELGEVTGITFTMVIKVNPKLFVATSIVRPASGAQVPASPSALSSTGAIVQPLSANQIP